jgi:hypothetical protein
MKEVENASCAQCGARMSKAEIEKQASKVAEDAVKKMLKGLKF